MTALSPTGLVGLADPIIHDVGSAFMMDPWTMSQGESLGFPDGICFYFAGRGGVLGNVDGDVVAAAMGWFQPALVRSMWESGIAVTSPNRAAQLYFEACAEWGRNHLTGVEGLDRFAALAERVVAAAEPSGLPLFAGWRRQPRVSDPPGLAIQLVHVLRELRGGLHLIATTAAGLSPAEAIATNDGPAHATMLGWADPPNPTALMNRHADAMSITDQLCAAVYDASLTGEEKREFGELTARVGAVVL